MSDIADQSDERIQIDIEQGILLARRAPSLQPKGACHYCDEPAERLFCSSECREDYDTEQAQLKRMGRKAL